MKVLLALDGSSAAIRAARVAARLFPADTTEFLAIDVAAQPMPWVWPAGFGMVAPVAVGTWPLVDEAVPDDAGDARREELARRAEGAGIAADVEVRSGDAVVQICAAADEHDVDVIVVGTHDKSRLRRLFDPSVADAVVHGTHRPVLVVSERQDR